MIRSLRYSSFLMLIAVAQLCAAEQTQVQDAMSQPIEGVLVRSLSPSLLQIPPADEQWTTIGITGRDGRFTSEQSTTRSFYILSKPGHATLALDAQKTPEIAVNLLEGAVISGVVLDEKGTSVPNALVGPVHPMKPVLDRTVAAPAPSSAGAPIWTRTDASGRFHITGLEPGLQGFLIEANGYAPHVVARPTGLETSITLSTSGTTWTGVLLGSRDKKPQPGIYVEASSEMLRLTTRTDADGAFTFPLLPGDEWYFRTTSHPTSPPKAAMMANRQRTAKGNEISLLHNQGVAAGGWVLSAGTTEPIANVQLELDAFQGEEALFTSTDERGYFWFENADAFRALTLRFKDYVVRTPQNTYWSEITLSTLKAEDQTTLTYGVLARVPIQGRVTGPNNRLIPNANITLRLRNTPQPNFGDLIGKVKYQAKSSPTGEFETVLFPPGTYEVEASTQFLTASKQSYDAASSPTRELLIALQPRMKVRGRTLDAAGSPLGDCRLEMHSTEDQTSATQTSKLVNSTRSDATGQFVFDGIFPDRATLSAMHPSSDDAVTTELLMPGGKTTSPVDLQFAAGQVFSAAVVDENQTPVPNATIQVYACIAADTATSDAKMLSRRTNEAGRATFGLHAKRLHRVSVRHKNFAPFTAGPVLLPQENYQVVLRANPSISVSISGDAMSGEEKRQVWLLRADRARYDDPLSAFFQTMRREETAAKSVEFRNVQPGWYKASTSNGTVYSESEAVEVKPDSGTVKLQLEVATGTTLKGRVFDEETGHPVAAAQVTIQLPCCPPQGFESDPVSSAADGTFDFAGLPTGAMVLTVKHADYSQRAMHVLVPKQASKTVEVKLGRGASVLSGRVTLDGKPLANAAIYIARAENRGDYTQSAATNADGKYTIEGLPEGNHVLTAQALYGPEQVDLRRSVEIRVKGQRETANVELNGLVRVRGTVRRSAEEEGPTPYASLSFSERANPDELGQSFREARLNPEGEYEIYLEPGQYTVGLQEGPGAPLDVPPGARELTVNYELRDLIEASGMQVVGPNDLVVPKSVPDSEGL